MCPGAGGCGGGGRRRQTTAAVLVTGAAWQRLLGPLNFPMTVVVLRK
jgi:hypothetical protein